VESSLIFYIYRRKINSFEFAFEMMESVPVEIHERIATFLNITDAIQFCNTCRMLHAEPQRFSMIPLPNNNNRASSTENNDTILDDDGGNHNATELVATHTTSDDMIHRWSNFSSIFTPKKRIHSVVLRDTYRNQCWFCLKGQLMIVASTATTNQHQIVATSYLASHNTEKTLQIDFVTHNTTVTDENNIAYSLWYKVGDGCGHTLFIRKFTMPLVIFYDPGLDVSKTYHAVGVHDSRLLDQIAATNEEDNDGSASTTISPLYLFQSLHTAVQEMLIQLHNNPNTDTNTDETKFITDETIIMNEAISNFLNCMGIQMNEQSLTALGQILSSIITFRQQHNNIHNQQQYDVNHNSNTDTTPVLASNTDDLYDNNANRKNNDQGVTEDMQVNQQCLPFTPSVSVSTPSMSDSSSYSSSQLEELSASEVSLSSISESSYTSSSSEESSYYSMASSPSFQCSIHNIITDDDDDDDGEYDEDYNEDYNEDYDEDGDEDYDDDDTAALSASTESSSTDESSSDEEEDEIESVNFVGKTLVVPQLLIIDSSPYPSYLFIPKVEDITDDNFDHNYDDNTSSSASTEEYTTTLSYDDTENEEEDEDENVSIEFVHNTVDFPQSAIIESSHSSSRISTSKVESITDDEDYDDYTSSEASAEEYSNSDEYSDDVDDNTDDEDDDNEHIDVAGKTFAFPQLVINNSSSSPSYLPAKIEEITDDNYNGDTTSSEASYTSSEASTEEYSYPDNETEEEDSDTDDDEEKEDKDGDESISFVGKTFAFPQLVIASSSASRNYLPAKLEEVTDDNYDGHTTSSESSTYTSYTSSEASTEEYPTSDDESEEYDHVNSNDELDDNESMYFVDKANAFQRLIIVDSSSSPSFHSTPKVEAITGNNEDGTVSSGVISLEAPSESYFTSDDDAGDDDNEDEDGNDNESINFVEKNIIFPRLAINNPPNNNLPAKVEEIVEC